MNRTPASKVIIALALLCWIAELTPSRAQTPTQIFLTTGTSWTVPSNWNSSNNTIEVIGGGGGGGAGTGGVHVGGGGGGGAYSKSSNVALTPGSSIGIQIGSAGAGGTGSGAGGSAGGDTYICNSSSNCSSISGAAVQVGAKGGQGGIISTGGNSGAASSGVGSTKYSGGNGGGGSSSPSNANGGGGGGGAAGPNGAGQAGGTSSGNDGATGAAGAGGGGAGGGSATAGSANTPVNTGGSGGAARDGTAGGAGGTSTGTAPSNGSRGSGGGGGGNDPSTDTATAGANGGSGVEWSGSYGAGGGGGGGGGGGDVTASMAGGSGGSYGGGGGGGAVAGGTYYGNGGNGAPGIIVITYTPGPPVLSSGGGGAAPALSAAGGMGLPGKLDVGATGAATYTIPIAVPPGTAGMVPALTLSYNSQAGNGLLGVGWSLGGLPSIGRCARTMAQDGVAGGVNYDLNDRYCLEGQRLMVISGTYGAAGSQYRTEIESFSEIIAHGQAGNGPAWFEVHSKSGQIMQFGNTTDSLILAQGKSTARSWAVNQVSDTKGNYFTVTYTNDATNGQAYPIAINYTGNTSAGLTPYNSVQFVYAPRPDITPMYQADSLMKTTVRLTDVETYIGNTMVNDYKLAYQQSTSTSRSRIISVTQCTGNNGPCLPATGFTWTDPGVAAWTAQSSTFPFGWNFQIGQFTPITGDFNGDGKTDFLFVTGQSFELFLSNGDGTFTPQYIPTPSGWNFLPGQFTPVIGDFNGDGKTDFALIASASIEVFLSNGDGTFTPGYIPAPNGWSFQPSQLTPIVGDFNGDGRTDFLVVAGQNFEVFLSNGDGTFATQNVPTSDSWNFLPGQFAPVVGDFNGDGKTDFALIASQSVEVFLSNGDGTFTPGYVPAPNGWSFQPSQLTQIVGDFNADGKTDFLIVAGQNFELFLSNGDGTFTAQNVPTPNNWNFLPGQFTSVVGDFNGDGKTDFALIASVSVELFLSNGDGTFTPEYIPAPNGWSFSPGQFATIDGDFNGDGKTDFLAAVGTSYWMFTTSGVFPDFLSTIATGLGATTSLTYLPLTNSSVYTKDSTTTYPQQDVQVSLYVTSRVDASNGVGGTYSSAYAYAGAKVDLSGRGFLGFRQMVATDLQTNVVQTTNYLQTFPYFGLIASKTKTLNGATLNSTTNAYQFLNASGAASISTPSNTNAPYQVSLQNSVESSWDLDGSVIWPVTTSYQYDGYGNAIQVSVATPDGYSKVTNNTYANDTTNWFLGRLTSASVVSQTGSDTPPPLPPPVLTATLTYTTPGTLTWTAPRNLDHVTAIAYGGGGGGGAGGYGGGACGANGGAWGAAGGNSSFATLTANGGVAGGAGGPSVAQYGSGVAGTGGGASGADTTYAGNNGQQTNTTAGGAGGTSTGPSAGSYGNAGAGGAAWGGSNTGGGGGGGGAGGGGQKTFTAASLGSTVTVTVGAGGAGSPAVSGGCMGGYAGANGSNGAVIIYVYTRA